MNIYVGKCINILNEIKFLLWLVCQAVVFAVHGLQQGKLDKPK